MLLVDKRIGLNGEFREAEKDADIKCKITSKKCGNIIFFLRILI